MTFRDGENLCVVGRIKPSISLEIERKGEARQGGGVRWGISCIAQFEWRNHNRALDMALRSLKVTYEPTKSITSCVIELDNTL